jgi:hypothetical protein
MSPFVFLTTLRARVDLGGHAVASVEADERAAVRAHMRIHALTPFALEDDSHDRHATHGSAIRASRFLTGFLTPGLADFAPDGYSRRSVRRVLHRHGQPAARPSCHNRRCNGPRRSRRGPMSITLMICVRSFRARSGPPPACGRAAWSSRTRSPPFDRDGGAAEYAAVPASLLAPKPASLSHVESAAVPLPAKGRHTRHIGEASRRRRMDAYGADVRALKSTHNQDQAPWLGLVDLETGEVKQL